MKKVTIISSLLALPVFFLFSCKPSLKVSSDYDRSVNFAAYKSFSLYYMISNKNVSELNEDRIWNSIRTEMLRKGYVENNTDPDLVVNALSVVKNKRYVTASSNIYGYGGAYRPYTYWGGYGMASGNTTFQANTYKEGSLIIDVVDTKAKKLIWEGTGNAEFEKKPKNPDEVISEAVAKIMADFPGGNASAKR